MSIDFGRRIVLDIKVEWFQASTIEAYLAAVRFRE